MGVQVYRNSIQYSEGSLLTITYIASTLITLTLAHYLQSETNLPAQCKVPSLRIPMTCFVISCASFGMTPLFLYKNHLNKVLGSQC